MLFCWKLIISILNMYMRGSESSCCILTRQPLFLHPPIHLHEYIIHDSFVCLPGKLYCYSFLKKIPNSGQSLNLSGSQVLCLCNLALSALEFYDGFVFSLQILFISLPLALNSCHPCTMPKDQRPHSDGEGNDVTDASSTSLSFVDSREDHRHVTIHSSTCLTPAWVFLPNIKTSQREKK